MSEQRYDTPEEAESAFYAAFMRHDVDAMMAVWATDDNISCIHPLGQVLLGRAAIRASWEAIFRNSPNLQITINVRVQGNEGHFAVRVVEEHIRAGSEPPGTPIQATNVYHHTVSGWRMVLHHASPAPQSGAQPNDAPTLH